MDRKIDILRKISITPWADPHRAAENSGRDYVMAAKPNPAFVATLPFNPEPVKQEIAHPTQWAATVNATIDQDCA